ncbi:spore coat associated protein CotJA [Bacillus sp. WMMC1349]|uniref:spore coat associated protein CotJA n=1 Tax=Bacillus sp. WMMC1349 TaxID=2736254 RepID=UPI001553E00C|nr:spore coat associated protein CotJA [Bacillus sp. WMMC1349]NPC92117.1 spore coat associated protein CotJA [Bacillus sp. WMMC1349]
MKHSEESFTKIKSYRPFHSAFDPCPPLGRRYYRTPPHLYLGFQPRGLQQFAPMEALRRGTLWPIFYDYYENPYENGREGG